MILSSGKPNLVCVDVRVPVGLGMDSHDGLVRPLAWVTRWICWPSTYMNECHSRATNGPNGPASVPTRRFSLVTVVLDRSGSGLGAVGRGNAIIVIYRFPPSLLVQLCPMTPLLSSNPSHMRALCFQLDSLTHSFALVG